MPKPILDPNDRSSNPSQQSTFQDVLETRLSRRAVLRGVATAAGGAWVASVPTPAAARQASVNSSTLTFREVAHVPLDSDAARTHAVADGYRCQLLLRWGDPLLRDAAPFNPAAQTAEAQERQFGYNNDFLAFLPLRPGEQNSEHGLLCVNHEYTNTELMFPGLDSTNRVGKVTAQQVAVEMAAHGHSVVEIRQTDGAWQVVADSPRHRRITMTTPTRVSGPAAGHDKLKTAEDPSGCRVLGVLNACAGGVTPWGTVLIAEENFDNYFLGESSRTAYAKIHARYGVGVIESGEHSALYGWGRFLDRFDVERTPHEPFRFGWIVEFDPYDMASVPVKRTALGRMKHEGATTVVNKDGRLVVYTGDDQAHEYLYRFVSDAKVNLQDRAANRDLLDAGTLSVAQFQADGSLRWLPLRHGYGPLTAENGFHGQGDVVIECRRAADLVMATPLDRPEDVETNPYNGRVYAVLTNNTQRTRTNAANVRAPNPWGHILELIPPDGDHGADVFAWNCFLRGGDPRNGEHGAQYHEGVSADGWLAAPDNVAFDAAGRMWIATDGAAKAVRRLDGVYACDTQGTGKALTRLFFRAPAGAEVCGPCFTPDGKTLFLAIQHPGEGSTFDKPSTRWPDDQHGMPPRPSVVAITRADGGPIGT